MHKETGTDALCLAGGVGLNCVGNGRALREGPFQNLWIQPTASDAGGAIWAALTAWPDVPEQQIFPDWGGRTVPVKCDDSA